MVQDGIENRYCVHACKDKPGVAVKVLQSVFELGDAFRFLNDFDGRRRQDARALFCQQILQKGGLLLRARDQHRLSLKSLLQQRGDVFGNQQQYRSLAERAAFERDTAGIRGNDVPVFRLTDQHGASRNGAESR